LTDILLCEAFGWTYDEVGDAPHWFVERALLWLDARAAWRLRQE